MRTGELISWLLCAPIFSFISWKYGALQIISIYSDVTLSVTDFLIISWVFLGYKAIFLQAHATGIYQNIKAFIQCLARKYWCKEKGWWIKCSHDCINCQIQTKIKITLWKARLFYIIYTLCIFALFLVGLYIIRYPEAVWRVI